LVHTADFVDPAEGAVEAEVAVAVVVVVVPARAFGLDVLDGVPEPSAFWLRLLS
jgi:hypothetical protein